MASINVSSPSLANAIAFLVKQTRRLCQFLDQSSFMSENDLFENIL
jgi:hypothetical protein